MNKICTDINQSKVLAEILPIESADMHYNNVSIKGINYVDEYRAELMDYNTAQKVLSKYLVNPMFEIVPCWSLSALLGVLPEGVIENYYAPNLQKEEGKYSIAYGNEKLLCIADNPIDACVEMVLKLHELNLL